MTRHVLVLDTSVLCCLLKVPGKETAGLTIGDATIKDVAEYYARAGWHVEILTGDAGLKSYEPSAPVRVPRRRR